MTFDRRLEEVLNERLGPLKGGRLPDRIIRRMRRRRTATLTAICAVLVMVPSGTWVMATRTDSHPSRAPTPAGEGPAPESPNGSIPVETPSPDTNNAGRCETGLWSRDCPEATWARQVAEDAGLVVAEDTGTALVVEGSGVSLFLWASEGKVEADRTPALEREGYEPAGTVGDTKVFGDANRLTWETQGLYVWLAREDFARIELSTPGVTDLVSASGRVEWP